MSNQLSALTEIDALDQLSNADRIAVLTALRDAVDARLKNEKAVVIERLAGATENMPIPTRGGDLTYKAAERPVVYDDELLLEAARAAAPHLVIPRVVYDIDPALLKSLKADVAQIDVDGEIVLASKSTGEILDYASLGAEKDASIAWPASSAQKIMKAEARKLLADHLGELVKPMLPAAPAPVVPIISADVAGDDEEF